MLPGESHPAVDLQSALGGDDAGIESCCNGEITRKSDWSSSSSAAASTWLRAPSSATNMSAHRCDTAWKLPMGRPNWWRSLAQ